GPIKLVHHAAQQIDIDLPVGGNEAGADFDDYSHVFLARAISRCRESPMGRMQPGRDNTSILPLEWAFWQVEFTAMPTSNATSRFSDRVENYVRYRPGYPAEALEALSDECGLRPEHVVADIASGTGIWTRMLLENGNPVFGVEPNADMRAAGERLLSEFTHFTSAAGTAALSPLPSQRRW